MKDIAGASGVGSKREPPTPEDDQLTDGADRRSLDAIVDRSRMFARHSHTVGQLTSEKYNGGTNNRRHARRRSRRSCSWVRKAHTRSCVLLLGSRRHRPARHSSRANSPDRPPSRSHDQAARSQYESKSRQSPPDPRRHEQDGKSRGELQICRNEVGPRHVPDHRFVVRNAAPGRCLHALPSGRQIDGLNFPPLAGRGSTMTGATRSAGSLRIAYWSTTFASWPTPPRQSEISLGARPDLVLAISFFRAAPA